MNAQSRPLYDPALIDRGEDGQFWHPDLPFPEGAEASDEENVDIAAEIDKQGYEYTRVRGDDCPDDLAEEGGDGYWQWLREWQPETPAGDGWLLACIADTEDGPAAWFVRPKG